MTDTAVAGQTSLVKPSASYWREIRFNWRALAAASAGLGAGNLLHHYISAIFAPHLLAEFGWSNADFALTGVLNLTALLFIPLVGHFTDLFGVRRVAFVGVVSLPLVFVALSMQNGSLTVFAAICTAQYIFAATTTTSTVYSRLVAERFVSARGLALAIAATTPSLVGLIGSPLLHLVIDAYGWRIGYLAVAAYCLVVGVIALLLIPARSIGKAAVPNSRPVPRRSIAQYDLILRSPAFWIIFTAMLLCNLVYPLQSSQLMLMLIDKGAGATAGWMISLFAAGVMFGRFACGVALDHYPSHFVAAIAMGLPSASLLMLATGVDALPVLAGSVMLLGLSLGAESDLAAYLVIRFFPIDVYSTVLSLVVVAIAISAASGAVMLSAALKLGSGFDAYMTIAGLAGIAGAVMFLLLGRQEPLDPYKNII